MRKAFLNLASCMLIIVTCCHFSWAAGSNNLERAVIFAIKQEVKASDLASGKDVCIGLGHGLGLHENAIVSNLKHAGVNAHESGWCTQHGQGLSIAVLTPVKQPSHGTFEVIVQVGNPVVNREEHFATLLKRGIYSIRTGGSSEPQLISYKQTCCSKTS